MLHDVLASHGFNGKLLAHVMPWFTIAPGKNFHPVSAYDSNNPLTIGKQLTVMQRCGVDGVILTYQGWLAPFQHSTAVEMAKQCAERDMLFALLMDPWAAKIGTGTKEQLMQSVIDNADVQAILNSPCYLPEKYILDFNTGVDWTKVNQPRPILGLNKGFSWSHDAGDVDPIFSLKDTYSKHNIKIGSLSMSFFDGGMPLANGKLDFNQQNWGTVSSPAGPARYSSDRAGNYFWDQLEAQPLNTLSYIALETWNDYNERTAWEPWCSVFANKRIC